MVKVGKGIHSRQTARHVQRPRGLEVSLQNQESYGWFWRLQKAQGPGPPEQLPAFVPGPPPAPRRSSSRPQCPLSLLSQSRGLSSTLCPAQATGSVSPAWTLTRCLRSPHFSWTSCSTPTGTAPLDMKGCRVGQGDTTLPGSPSLRGETASCHLPWKLVWGWGRGSWLYPEATLQEGRQLWEPQNLVKPQGHMSMESTRHSLSPELQGQARSVGELRGFHLAGSK